MKDILNSRLKEINAKIKFTKTSFKSSHNSFLQIGVEILRVKKLAELNGAKKEIKYLLSL